MKKTMITAAVAALLSAGAFSTASAAPALAAPQAITGQAIEQVHFNGNKKGGHHGDWRGRHRILPQRVVIRSLHQRGYRDIRNVRLVRGDYVMRARGYRGPVRLVVDGKSGRILSRQALHRGHRPGIRLHGGNGNFSYSFGIR